jgi:predicted ferric reductase
MTTHRSRWKDGLKASVWVVASTAVALNIADGGLQVSGAYGWVRESARLLGMVAAVLMMTQVLLASRTPWIERVVGHDRAISTHSTLGKYAILLMLCHVALITFSTSMLTRWGVVQSFFELGKGNRPLAAATLAIGLFALVLVTSLFAAFRRWNYESWHLVHRVTYVAIALVVPHQFLEGSTFRDGGVAWVVWLLLYSVAFGSFVIWRMARPLYLAARHRARVSRVVVERDGSTTIEIAGRSLDRLKSRPGQFFLWRFHTRGLWWQKHPFSLSSVPRREGLRITVKSSGHGTRAIATVRPGTRVTFEGPLGVFTHHSRTRSGLVLMGAGIGITPIRSMLEDVELGEDCTVIVRASSRDEAPLIDEVEQLASDKAAVLIEAYGPRGEGWGTADKPGRLSALVPHLRDADIYICGPTAWARAVAQDARDSGVSAEAIHRERFGW